MNKNTYEVSDTSLRGINGIQILGMFFLGILLFLIMDGQAAQAKEIPDYQYETTSSAAMQLVSERNSVHVGDQFAVDVNVENVSGIYAEDFTLNYNPDVLTYYNGSLVKTEKLNFYNEYARLI